MEYVQTMYDEKAESTFYSKLAKITFSLYLFFLFFGTTLPFRERSRDLSEIGTSNVVTQIVFTLLFITASISLIPKIKDVLKVISKEKIFFIFLGFCLMSVVWSSYPFVSFKRFFQVFTAVTVAFSIFIHTRDSIDLLKYFKSILTPYLIISIITILIIPMARDENGAWRGLAPSKNHLGQAALVNMIFWALIFKYGSLKDKFFSIMAMMIAGALLVGSQSSTVLFTFLIICYVSMLMFFDKHMRAIQMKKVLFTVGIVLSIAMLLAVIYLAPDILASVFKSSGEDMSFTGRTDLWADIFRESQKHFLLGAGFQGFWVLDNRDLLALYDVYVWLPNQAHNGYLDVLNEVGIIGLVLFILMIINYFFYAAKLKGINYFKWFFLIALIVNFQESTFIRPQVLTGVLFMFSYIFLFVELYKQGRLEEEAFDL